MVQQINSAADEVDDLNKMFDKISRELDEDEVTRIKQLLKGKHIFNYHFNKLNTAMDIFHHLKDTGRIKEDNLNLLINLFDLIERSPLVKIIQCYQQHKGSPVQEVGESDNTSLSVTTEPQQLGELQEKSIQDQLSSSLSNMKSSLDQLKHRSSEITDTQKSTLLSTVKKLEYVAQQLTEEVNKSSSTQASGTTDRKKIPGISSSSVCSGCYHGNSIQNDTKPEVTERYVNDNDKYPTTDMDELQEITSKIEDEDTQVKSYQAHSVKEVSQNLESKHDNLFREVDLKMLMENKDESNTSHICTYQNSHTSPSSSDNNTSTNITCLQPNHVVSTEQASIVNEDVTASQRKHRNSMMSQSFLQSRCKNSEILLIGDSVTSGVSVKRMFPRNSAYHLDIATIAKARQIMRDIQSKMVNTVVYHLGKNDLECMSINDSLANFIQLIEITKRNMPNAQIIVSGVVKRRNAKQMNDKIDKFNLLLSNEARLEHNFIYVEHSENLYAEDGVHMNYRGTAMLVRDIKQQLRQLNKLPQSSYIKKDFCQNARSNPNSLHYHRIYNNQPNYANCVAWMSPHNSNSQSLHYQYHRKYKNQQHYADYWYHPKFKNQQHYAEYWCHCKYKNQQNYADYWYHPKYKNQPNYADYWYHPKYKNQQHYAEYWYHPKYKNYADYVAQMSPHKSKSLCYPCKYNNLQNHADYVSLMNPRMCY